ncbi:MAG: hypothetical protein HXX16_09960 [Bacteroidales bacterium]|nr:hypothetical protein [Bacteroidales bacterium]
MEQSDKNISFSEWQELTFSDKREIWNHYWNPYEPEIGFRTKKEIVDNFIKSININALQYGIGNFGWGVYELFIIVEDSSIIIPKTFSDISINKGVVKEWIDKNKVEVKFDYGGTTTIDLEQKIVIK